MPRPRIGVTMDVGVIDEGRKVWELPTDYARAVTDAGGLPLLLPPTDDADVRAEMIASIDALLIPGGNDLDPSLYGQPQHPKTRLTDEVRQAFDLAMLKLAEARRMPVLGICLGCQVMNVARGGTLHQHLPDVPLDDQPLQHSKTGDRTNAHGVQVDAGTLLARVIEVGQTMDCNSRHHQAIDRVGKGLIVSARAPDGVVEAVEDPAYPFWMAVQWHPENLAGTPHARLFEGFVKAAAAFGKSRAGDSRSG
jgi:putative glutamine amidotransferase